MIPVHLARKTQWILMMGAVILLFSAASHGSGLRPLSHTDSFNDLKVANGRLWVATTGGVLCFDFGTRRWSRYTTDDGLPSNGITALAVDGQDNVWVGTQDGLAVYENGSWNVYTTLDGLPDNAITAIAIDTSGEVWAASQAGLARFDGNSWFSWSESDLQALLDSDAGTGTRLSFKPPQVPAGLSQPAPDMSSFEAKEAILPPGVEPNAPWTVLIGTYDTRRQAFEVAARFREKGDEAFTSYVPPDMEPGAFDVFIGNFSTSAGAEAKARELKRRRFRRAEVTKRLFAVEVVACSSYIPAEEARALLRSAGHMPYTLRCEAVGLGKQRVYVGAFETELQARSLALDLMKERLASQMTVVVR